MDFYLVEKGVSPNGSDLAAVIKCTKIPFCRPVKLFDLNVSKPADELFPNIRSDPVPYRKSYFVASIVGFLPVKEIVSCFPSFL